MSKTVLFGGGWLEGRIKHSCDFELVVSSVHFSIFGQGYILVILGLVLLSAHNKV